MTEERSSSGSPIVRRRELGARLRALRTEQGLTIDQVAGELLCSPSKVSRMETGQRGATRRDIRDLCDLYGVTVTTERERLLELAREGKRQGWWQSLSLEHQDYVGLEQDAASLTIFQSAVVPGLLQTPAYTRAIHLVGVPPFDEATIKERVKERSTRQLLLDRDAPPQVDIFLDEPVLQRPLGGNQVMLEQLSRIIEETARSTLVVRVVPYSVGAHPALESNFTILKFEGPANPVVYVEGLVGPTYLQRPHELERYELVVTALRDLALGPEDSVDFIAGIRDSLIGEYS